MIKEIQTIHDAVCKSNQDAIVELVNKGHDIEYNNPKSMRFSPLELAINREDNESALCLIKSGANVNTHNPYWYGNTPLTLAACVGNTTIIQALLDHKADIEGTDKGGNTAIHLAAFRNQPEAIAFLLANDSDFYKKNKDGESAMAIAKSKKHDESIEIMSNFEKANFAKGNCCEIISDSFDYIETRSDSHESDEEFVIIGDCN